MTRMRVTSLRETGRFVRGLIAVGMISILTAIPASAQETGDIADSSTGVIFRWLNFAIVFALIVWGFRAAAPHFRSRSEEISRKIAEGARARQAADQQRAAAQQKLAGLPDEVARLRADAKRSGEAEAQRLRALAKTEAETIAKAAQEEIIAAQRAARLEMKALAARLAVEQAEALLRQQITSSEQANLFEAFVADLQESVN